MLRLALLAALVALLAATAASASTHAQYKAKLDAICRSYTPKLHREQTHLDTPQGLARLATLAVAQDDALLKQRVPTALVKSMRPLFVQLRLFDREAKAALRAAHSGEPAASLHYLLRMQAALRPLDKLFDSRGLRACGTEQ
jgi:hypothetical protein